MKHLTKPHFSSIICLLIIDGLVLCLTDPNTVPSFILIVTFLLLVVTFYYFIIAIIRAGSWYGLKPVHPRRLATVITIIGATIMALQSTGELTSRDILVMLPFVVLSYLYFSYGRAAHE